MISPRFAVLCALAATAPVFGAANRADIPTEAERAPVVELAASLSKPVDSAPLPALKSPFGYDMALVADPSAPGGAVQPTGTKASREKLEELANYVVSQKPNYVELRGVKYMQVGRKTYAVGDKIQVNDGGKLYDLEVAGIPNRTTYILKYNGETTTRSTNAK